MQRQINNLARRWKRAKAKAAACRQRSFGTPGRMQRCRTNSPQCLMVYFLAGRSSAAAVDFVLGRGWACRSKRSKRVGCVAAVAFQDAEVVRQIQIGVEEAVGSAAPSAFVALQTDPLTHFEFSDLLSVHKYVLELEFISLDCKPECYSRGCTFSGASVCAMSSANFRPCSSSNTGKVAQTGSWKCPQAAEVASAFSKSLGSTTWWFACPRTYFSRTAAREGNL